MSSSYVPRLSTQCPRFQWPPVWSNSSKVTMRSRACLLGLRSLSDSVVSGEAFCCVSLQDGPMGLTRYWVPRSVLWKWRQLWGNRLKRTLMRLWYQETVMERKQSWGGFTALSLPLQSHPRCLPSSPAAVLTPCSQALTSWGSMSAMDLAWTASKSSSSSARARRPPSLSRSGPGGSSKKRRFQRVSRRQCPPANLTS